MPSRSLDSTQYCVHMDVYLLGIDDLSKTSNSIVFNDVTNQPATKAISEDVSSTYLNLLIHSLLYKMNVYGLPAKCQSLY